MTDFLVYRSCDLTDLGVRRILMRNADIVNRAISLIDGDAGVPDDSSPGSDNPSLDITTAEWSDVIDGNGTLPPGTYNYDVVPVDTCTGRTGQPIALPPLTITSLGQIATLRVQFNTTPAGCDALQLRRDGVVVTPPFPLEDNVPENVTLVDTPNPYGTYINGTDRTFERVSGADLVADDVVKYNNFGVKVTQVVSGTDVTFAPKIPAELLTPPGFYDAAGRSGFYEAFSTMNATVGVTSLPLFPNVSGSWIPQWPPGLGFFWNGPFMSFKVLNFNPFTGNIPGVTIPPPPWIDEPTDLLIQAAIDALPAPTEFLSDIQTGDIIAYGSKTAIVVYVERNFLLQPAFGFTGPGPAFGTVLIIPFGILPIPPFPAGQFWIVYRPEQPLTLGTYYTCYREPGHGPANPDNTPPANVAAVGFDHFNDVGPSLVRGFETLAPDFLPSGPISGSPFSQPATNDPLNNRTRLNAFRVVGNGEINPLSFPPTLTPGVGPPTALTPGRQLLVDGQLVTVTQVTEIIPPGYDKDGNPQLDGFGDPMPPYFGEYEVEFTQPLTPDPVSIFGPVSFSRPFIGAGPWLTIPSFLSPYLKEPSIAPTGQYERLTRRVTIRTEAKTWQWAEDGSYQTRAGTVDGAAAATTLNEVFVQNGYPGGLKGLLDRIRGSRETTVSDVFVVTNGDLTKVGNRLLAVNTLAPDGNGAVIDLSRIREMEDETCGSVSRLFESVTEVKSSGFVVLRLVSREVQVPAARCPPGQPDAREVQLFCQGLATPQQPLAAGEYARVYWRPGAQAQSGIRAKLRRLGLTDDETDGALNLTTAGRLLTVRELSLDLIQDITDLDGLGSSSDVQDVLDDGRIGRINIGTISRGMVQKIIRRRGNAGIVRRFVGTDPTEAEKPGARPVDDLILPMHHLAALAFQFNASFDVFDVDAAIQSIPDAELRARVAAVFAASEGVLNALLLGGKTLTDFLENTPGFQEALDAIGGIVSGSDGDPTLACLVGSLGTGALSPGISLPTPPATLNAVSSFIGTFAPNFITRFNLSSLFSQAVSATLCSIGNLVEKVYNLLGGDSSSAGVQRAIGCLPSIEDLQAAGIDFPSFEVQVALECNLDQLNLLLDIIQALIAEANELVDFANAFKSGFATQLVEARSRQCTSDQGVESLVNGFRLFLGIG